MAGLAHPSSDAADRPAWRGSGQVAALWFVAGLMLAGLLLAQEPPLSPRAPLIDAAARAEVDGYGRLDQVMRRTSALPDVFDPDVYSMGASVVDLRGMILGYILWLQGAEASHLEMIETFPARLSGIPTREPYRQEFIEHYRATTPERYRRVQAYYQEELAAAENRVAFLELISAGGVRPRPDGFAFGSEADKAKYRELIAAMNSSFAEQDARIGAYYAWEIDQKSALKGFRDRL